MEHHKRRILGFLGIGSVTLFVGAFFLFGALHPAFDFWNDYVSKLGAKGTPNALAWNVIGFGLGGLAFAGFGLGYGLLLKDKLAGGLLALFGIGFACTAVPMDFTEADQVFSKVHIVSINLALAFWLFGLARISFNPQFHQQIRTRANVAAILLVVGMIIGFMQIWPEAVSHKLVFMVVFGWTLLSAIELLSPQSLSIPENRPDPS